MYFCGKLYLFVLLLFAPYPEGEGPPPSKSGPDPRAPVLPKIHKTLVNCPTINHICTYKAQVKSMYILQCSTIKRMKKKPGA